jgi:predicted ferric reductase
MAGLTSSVVLVTLAEPTWRSMAALGARGVGGPLSAQVDTTLWYLTRTTAVAAYIALTLSVCLGMLRSIARTAKERLSWVVDELHAFVATLAGLLMMGHLVTLKLDDFIPFTFANLLLPGDQPYRPLAVNLGVFAFYAIALLLLSSWLRRRIPYRLWRALHYVSFVAFALVTAHGLLAGSDAGEAWLQAIYTGASCGVGFLVLMRLMSRPRAARQPL